MDLAALKPAETATMQVNHPLTGEPIEGASIELYGTDSRHYFGLQLDDVISRARGKFSEDEDLKDRLLAKFVAMTKSVKGLEYNGEPLDAKTLYTEFPWALEQVQKFVDDRANFFQSA